MRKLMLLALVVLLLMGLVLAAPVAANKGNPDHEVPFKGAFSGVLLGFNQDPEYIAERCFDRPAWAVTSFEGSGRVTHLGKTHVVAEHCSYLSGEPLEPDGTYGEGVLTLTAANGDVLKGTYTSGISTSGPPVIGFMDDFTFVDGGTGRFAHASGGGVEEGFVDATFGLEDAPTVWMMKGDISYHG
jgi:hypothetical protein